MLDILNLPFEDAAYDVAVGVALDVIFFQRAVLKQSDPAF
jgi:hypothetical protein